MGRTELIPPTGEFMNAFEDAKAMVAKTSKPYPEDSAWHLECAMELLERL
jgi:hypothetical protein